MVIVLCRQITEGRFSELLGHGWLWVNRFRRTGNAFQGFRHDYNTYRAQVYRNITRRPRRSVTPLIYAYISCCCIMPRRWWWWRRYIEAPIAEDMRPDYVDWIPPTWLNMAKIIGSAPRQLDNTSVVYKCVILCTLYFHHRAAIGHFQHNAPKVTHVKVSASHTQSTPSHTTKSIKIHLMRDFTSGRKKTVQKKVLGTWKFRWIYVVLFHYITGVSNTAAWPYILKRSSIHAGRTSFDALVFESWILFHYAF